MKTTLVIALIYLTVMVNGAWWATAAQPIIIGMGAIIAALDMDIRPMLDVKLFETFGAKGQKKGIFGN